MKTVRNANISQQYHTLVIVLSMLVFLAACTGQDVIETAVSPPAPSSTTPPLAKTTLIVGLATNSIVTLDPAAHSDRHTETVIRNIFDGLVTRTADNEIVPELASSYRWIDETTIDFNLKRDVIFHNGDSFTAQDVVFTFERIQTEEIGAPRRIFVQGIDRVEAVNEYTVRFHLKYAWPVFLSLLAHTQIVPQSYVTAVGDEAFALAPIGTGPFRFVSGDLDGDITLSRFDAYYGGADALPPVAPALLDTVIFRMIPQSEDRIAALIAGDVQLIQNVPTTAVSDLITIPAITIKTTAGTRPKLMDINVTLPPFDDVRVRQALQYAIDTDALLEETADNYGIPMQGPISPANQYADSSLPGYEYNPERAKQLLMEAGHPPDTIFLTIDTVPDNAPIAHAIAAQLEALGMHITVSEWQIEQIKPQLLACERHAFIKDWGDSIFDPVGYIEAKWQTRDETSSAGRGNYACYSNIEVDALIEAGASEADEEKRHEIYDEAQRLIHDESPSLFLYVPQEVGASSMRVHNWQPSPDGRINLHDVWLSE